MSNATIIKVRGYHLDVYQHVNNARYLEFLEEARWQWLEDHGAFDWMMKEAIAFMVVNLNINYRRGAVLMMSWWWKVNCISLMAVAAC